MNDPEEARGRAAAVAAPVNDAANATAVPRLVVNVTSFRTAVRDLDSIAARGGTIDQLDVREGMRRWEAQDFRRFVERLGRGDLVIHRIRFPMYCWGGMPDDDMELLFGQVLPYHRTLRSIHIIPGRTPSPFLRLLTESIPPAAKTRPRPRTTRTTPLRELVFDFVPVQHEDSEAIAAMVDRNVYLEALTVNLGSSTQGARRLCRAVAGNTNLRKFTICMDQIWADTLGSVASSSSSLRELHVRGRFPGGDWVANLANQLRTNTTITRLILAVTTDIFGLLRRLSEDELFQPLLDVLETYNFTLGTLTVNEGYSRWSGQVRATELLGRNERIQRALEQLEPNSYRIEPIELAPRVLEMVRNLPTLLYRFIRRGNVNRLLAAEQGERRLRTDERMPPIDIEQGDPA